MHQRRPRWSRLATRPCDTARPRCPDRLNGHDRSRCSAIIDPMVAECALLVGDDLCRIQAVARCDICARPYCPSHGPKIDPYLYQHVRICTECSAAKEAEGQALMKANAAAAAFARQAKEAAIEASRQPMNEADLRHYLAQPVDHREVSGPNGIETRYFRLDAIPAEVFGRAVRDTRHDDGRARLGRGPFSVRGWGVGNRYFVSIPGGRRAGGRDLRCNGRPGPRRPARPAAPYQRGGRLSARHGLLRCRSLRRGPGSSTGT
jgi:hypothetical protein